MYREETPPSFTIPGPFLYSKALKEAKELNTFD
jgi:hypothetical protein